MPRKLIIVGVIVLAVLFIGALAFVVTKQLTAKKVTLTVWTLQGTQGGVRSAADTFAKQNPGIGIKIVPIAETNYEVQFLYALAAQKEVDGIAPPDVVVLPNESLRLHRAKLVPAPDGVLDSALHGYEPSASGGPTPSPLPKGRANATIVKQDYPPLVLSDTVSDGKVMAVALNNDPLVMFYNRSLLSQPPATWNDVAGMAKRVTSRNGSTINRSGVALGTSNLTYAADIVSLLMLQNGVTMVKENESLAGFNLPIASGVNAGANALDFYASFAKPNRETYSWNATLGSSLAAVKSGKTALAFGYGSDWETVSGASVGVAPVPQVDVKNPKTYGRFLAIGVTKQAKDPNAAWQFASMFANPNVAAAYATATRGLPARLDAAKLMTLDDAATVLAQQSATTVNWPKKEMGVADGAILEAIRLNEGGRSSADSLDVAAKAYTSFLQSDAGIPKEREHMSLWIRDDDTTNYTAFIEEFLRERGEVNRVIVSKRGKDRFEWEVLNAMAARLGPDLVAVPSDSLYRYRHVLKPLPVGTFKPQDIKATDREVLERLYVPSVAQSVLIDNRIYGMPTNIESLMLIMNRDVYKQIETAKFDEGDTAFDEATDLFYNGPVTWGDLEAMSQLLTERQGATIVRSGLALGAGSNVANAGDIYAAFVKQAGGDINNPDKIRSGIQLPISSSDPNVPGREALDFILSFSNPSHPNYSWNKSLPLSLEALASGKAVMAFAYPRDIAAIKRLNPAINLALFPLPQIDDVSSPVDFASHFSLAVPVATTKSTSALAFLTQAVSKAGLRDRVAPAKTEDSVETLDRPSHGNPQTLQANTAATYFKGNYPREVDAILERLLDRQLTLDAAARELNTVLSKKLVYQ